MYISHIALWTRDVEKLKYFYIKHFDAQSNKKYTNPAKGFESYFLSFASGAALEIMSKTTITAQSSADSLGYCHFALKVESKAEVDAMTEKLRSAGVKIVSEPRTTGDGYYESVVSDPDGNYIEITA